MTIRGRYLYTWRMRDRGLHAYDRCRYTGNIHGMPQCKNERAGIYTRAHIPYTPYKEWHELSEQGIRKRCEQTTILGDT